MKLHFLSSKGSNTQTFYNFLSTVMRSGIMFFTMPLFTRLLGAEQYGVYSIYASWLTIFICFMGVNVKAGLGTGFYKFGKDYYKFRSSTLVEGISISAGFIAILLFAYPIIGRYFRYSVFVFAILLVEAFAQFVIDFANLSWIYEKRAGSNMLLSISVLVLTSVLSVVLLVLWKGQAENLYLGRVLGTAIPQIVIAMILGIILFKEAPYGYDRGYWRYSFLFGLPLVFHTLSQQVLGHSDRLMMQWFHIGNDDIGIYSFFFSYVAILTTILNALNNSWCPFLYDDLQKKNYQVLNGKVSNYVQIFTIMTLGFLMVSREVMWVFASSEYWRGADLIPLFVLIVFCSYIYQFAVNYEFFNAKPRIVALGTIMAASSNIALNALMIPRYGMYGAAIATLISYVMLAVMHTIVVKTWDLERYPLTYKPVLIGLGLTFIGCVAFYCLKDLIVIRWGIGVGLGFYLVHEVLKRKTIF